MTDKDFQLFREAGLRTSFPGVEIPDEYWQHEEIKQSLVDYGYKPRFRHDLDPKTSPLSHTHEMGIDSQQPEAVEGAPLGVASAQMLSLPALTVPTPSQASKSAYQLVLDTVLTRIIGSDGSGQGEASTSVGRRRRNGVGRFFKSLAFRR